MKKEFKLDQELGEKSWSASKLTIDKKNYHHKIVRNEEIIDQFKRKKSSAVIRQVKLADSSVIDCESTTNSQKYNPMSENYLKVS